VISHCRAHPEWGESSIKRVSRPVRMLKSSAIDVQVIELANKVSSVA
jgi:hypothetical protein